MSEVVPASCSEGNATTDDYGIEVIRIKVEEGADVHKKVDPVAITFTVVKSEHEVSSVTISVHCETHFTIIHQTLSFFSSHPSVCLSF
jgi:hypothetical protein